MTEAIAVQPGQRWRRPDQARKLHGEGLDAEHAVVEIVGVDWLRTKARCRRVTDGHVSHRLIRSITERCELVPSPKPPIEYRGIGGSQAAAAVGEHPYVPPIKLWGELVGELPPFEGNRFTRWGTALEPPIRKEYSERHGYKILVPDGPYYHPEHPWARATPDGIVAGSHGCEIKCVGHHSSHRWGDDGSGAEGVPQEYRAQVAWYMWVYDLGRWDVAALIGGNDYREYTIERDLQLEAVLVEVCSDFWHNHVLEKEPPEPDSSREYAEFIERHWSYRRDVYAPATVEGNKLAEELRELKAELKRAEKRKREIDNELRDAIGDAAGVETALGTIKCKPRSGKPKYKLIAQVLAAYVEQLTELDAGAVLERLTTDWREDGSRPVITPRNWSKENR